MVRKITPLQEFPDTETKRLQTVYLDHYGFTSEDISKWTGYAKSTVKNYIRKYADLLEEAKKIFLHITLKAKRVLHGGRQLVYLFKFYDKNNNELVCSKVGTTTRLPEERLKEELTYYAKHGFPDLKADICSVIDCGEVPAEGAESITRAVFIKRFPDKFKKNDRFFGVDIPTRTFNEVVNNYLKENITYN